MEHGNYLKWKHIRPIENERGEVIAAKIIVYADDSDEYYSFITPQAYHALKEWMDFRASYGEKITGESWVMRDIWQTTNTSYGAKGSLATYPKKLKSSGIKRLIEHALWEQGLRQPLKKGEKRHEWKAAHGMRKYCKSKAEQVMKPINVFLILDHDSGISESYYKPLEQEVLQDYLKAVPLLTIQGDKSGLEMQIKELKEKTEESTYERNSELLEWKKRYLNDVRGLIQQMNSMKEFQKETQKEMAELKKYRLFHMNHAFSP